MRAALACLVLLAAACHPKLTPVKVSIPSVELRYLGRDADADDFVLPDGAPPAVPHEKFTDADVRARLGARLQGDQVVFASGKKMPYARYLELLESYETFLNELGASLRGPDDNPILLALKPAAHPKLTPSSPGTLGDPNNPELAGAFGETCFWKGNVSSAWLDAKSCADGDAANDGWFGVDLCTNFNTILQYRHEEQSLVVHTWQDVLGKVVLFGVPVDAARLHGDLDWEHIKSNPGIGPQRGSSFSLNGTTQTKPVATADVRGPRVDLYVGPVPMRFEPTATVTGSSGKVDFALTKVPEECDAGEGLLTLSSRPELKVVASGGGDALVVRYQLDGGLTLADVKLAVETALSMHPARNQLEVAPRWTVESPERGAIYLAVDADFLIARKRWRLELARAVGSGSKTLTVEPKSFHTLTQ